MRVIKVKLGPRSYDIIVGRGIIRLLGGCIKKLDLGDSAYVITNDLIKRKYGAKISASLKAAKIRFKINTIPDTEKSKSINVLSSVIRDLAKFDLKSRTFIIALGGGVVGDLSGLAASIYKRGIPYIQIPTTLLAQVDSAIGGKTAVDLREGKNLVGAFYQPALVFSDVRLLKSLNRRQLGSGLAEVIKYGIIKDSLLFSYLEKECENILKAKEKSLERVVSASSKIKAEIVQADEREEKGLRTVLNFGHTLGHAIEAASGFQKYSHGEAIALGMLVALEISEELGFLKGNLRVRAQRLIKRAGLPVTIAKIPLRKIINAFHRDKKFSGARNKLVLSAGLGKIKIAENISLEIIKQAVINRIRQV